MKNVILKYIQVLTTRHLKAFLLIYLLENHTVTACFLSGWYIMQEEKVTVVPSVMRALDVIENLFASSKPKSLSELSKELHIPQASLFRILKSLTLRDYVSVIEEIPYKYSIAYKAIQLVSEYQDRYGYKDIKDMVKPEMVLLTKKTNQTAQYAVFQNNCFYYIEQVLSSADLNFIAKLYNPLEINTSAGAKIILANLPISVQNNYLSSVSLKKHTQNTVDDLSEFKKNLRQSFSRGYALDNEEFALGISCMAVPIFDRQNKCVGALGVTGSSKEYSNKKNFDHIYACLKEAATKIMKKMIV